MANFIRNKGVKCNMVNNIKQLQGFGQTALEFILFIYKSDWNALITNDNNRMFKQNLSSKFSPKINTSKPVKKAEH